MTIWRLEVTCFILYVPETNDTLPEKLTIAKLKPPCTKLNGIVLRYRARKASRDDVLRCLEELLECLHSIQKSNSKDFLDSKLAEYAFFPLSNVFQGQTIPSRALEISLQCLHVLLETGWKASIEPQLGLQLVLLLTFIVGGDTSKQGTTSMTVSEDAKKHALACLSATCHSISVTADARAHLLGDENAPALGHTITVIFDQARDNSNLQVRQMALMSLGSLLECVVETEAAVNFFPGIVSSLSKLLTFRSEKRQPQQVLSEALKLLASVLEMVISDRIHHPEAMNNPHSTSEQSRGASIADKTWLTATAAKLKLVLANMIKLRELDNRSVRASLAQLCLVVLEKCSETLSECCSMMFETLTILSSDDPSATGRVELQRLIILSDSYLVSLRSMLRNRLLALPPMMSSSDDSRKQRTLNQIRAIFSLLQGVGADTSFIKSELSAALRESIVSSLHSRSGRSIAESSNHIVSAHGSMNKFRPIVDLDGSEASSLSLLEGFLVQLAGSQVSLCVAREALDLAPVVDINARRGFLWLSLCILRKRGEFLPSLNVLIEEMPDSLEIELHEELYTLALDSLMRVEQGAVEDDTLFAVAMEIITLRAELMKHDFRHELVDVLYPILHCMGSNSPVLRHHATVSTNRIAAACSYDNSQDLLTSNADYLINAIALKLNMFDISPQAPLVLRMLIKLCGPTVLPYLDDLIDNIFEALECFHGYPKLVQVLFSVLDDVVTEGARANQFGADHVDQSFQTQTLQAKPSSLMQLVGSLNDAMAQSEISLKSGQDLLGFPEEVPKRPWKELSDEGALVHPDTLHGGDHHTGDKPSEGSLKPSPVYTMLKRITEMSQHHLPSSEPDIRASILRLLAKVLPCLATNQDSFLPLIHALWPVLVPRLSDSEAYVLCGVLEVMGIMCEMAGNFMRGRIEGIWPQISRLWDNVRSARPGTRVPFRLKRASLELQPTNESLASATSISPDISESANLVLLQPTSNPPEIIPTGKELAQTYVSTTDRNVRRALNQFAQRVITSVQVEVTLRLGLLTTLSEDTTVSGSREMLDKAAVQDSDTIWLLMRQLKQSNENRRRTSDVAINQSFSEPIAIDPAPTFADPAY